MKTCTCLSIGLAVTSLLVAGEALAQPSDLGPKPPPAPAPTGLAFELSTLRVLRAKGILSQAEYDSAVHDLADSSGARSGDDATVVVGRFATTLYGFVEADSIWDSTQSFTDVAGNGQVATPGSYAGQHARATFGVRNSRIGLRIKAPETRWLRASGVLEMDFLGATLPVGSGQPYFGTEAATFTSPTFRLRHAYLKLETPIADLLFGQYWHLFGWGPAYFPSTVQPQGIVGQVYARTPQIRLSKTIATGAVTVELAVAAMRPPQRDAGTPEGEAGLRLAIDKWTGMQTLNATGTQIAPLSVAVTGDVRRISVNELSATPKVANALVGASVAVDAFVPILPATRDRKGNSLSLSGEFVYGNGIADLYTGLAGGVSNPMLPNPTMTMPAPMYTPDIDPGIAAYSAGGTLSLIRWTTFDVGAQYYFPRLDGRLWVAANYARTSSPNAKDFGAAAKIRDHEDYYDANLFGDPLPGVRFGLKYAHYQDTYADGTRATNHRVQLSGFFIF